MNNPLVYQAIGVLLVLFYIFLLVMCWKTWRVTHVLFSFFVFAGAVTFLIFAALVLKTHSAWRTHYEQHTVAIEQLRAENERMLFGDLEVVQQTEGSIRSLRADLESAVVDRGRVWRECRPLKRLGEGEYQVRTVPISQPEGVPASPSGITEGTVLYAFTEQENQDGYRVPAFYLGEFTVVNATESDVSLRTQLPMAPDQVKAAGLANTSWVLYETLPLDSHHAFAEMDASERRMLGMDIERLREWMPNRYGLPEDQYQAMLERFHRFNREATDQDPPENLWVLVEFEKPHEIQVDSDVEQSLLDAGGRFFDSSGRALELRLRRGEDGTVTFRQGDSTIFDKETGDRLVSDGIARQIQVLYRRHLHDFAFFFRDAYHRHQTLDLEVMRAQRDAAIMTDLKSRAEEQMALRQQERSDLEHDLAGFQRELNEVTAYHEALQTRWRQTTQRLSELFRANNQMMDEMTRLQFEMARQINQRIQQASVAEDASGQP
ncbi:MAG: hypothetical protein EA424_10385 [Planctomycetaceae bacterium]|nr:MAG: hypothetical protein EA424_10385 [Planctomycetaceae bacterium]